MVQAARWGGGAMLRLQPPRCASFGFRGSITVDLTLATLVARKPGEQSGGLVTRRGGLCAAQPAAG